MKLIVATLISIQLFLCAAGFSLAANEVQPKGEASKVGALPAALSAGDVKFLRDCGVEQADIDIIPNLPPDGRDSLEILLDSPRKNCERDIIVSFKATRKFVRMHTPPPTRLPEIPARYQRYFMTVEEQVYISEIGRKYLEKIKKELETQQNRGK